MKNRIKYWVKIFLGILIVVVLIWKLQLKVSHIFTSIKDIKYVLYSILIPLFVIPPIVVNRWRVFLKEAGIKDSFWPLWKINIISIFQGLVIPSAQGHDIIRMYFIEKRHPGKSGKAASSVIIERLFGFWILNGLAIISFPYVIVKSNDPLPIIVSIIIITAINIIGTVLVFNTKILSFYSRFSFKNSFINNIFNFLSKLHSTLIFFPYKKVFFSSCIFILSYQLSTILSVYLIFKATGYPVSFIHNMAVYPIIGMLNILPITFGGFGIREGAFVYFYGLLGVPPETAICVSITNYLILSITPAILGALLYSYESIRGNELIPTYKSENNE